MSSQHSTHTYIAAAFEPHSGQRKALVLINVDASAPTFDSHVITRSDKRKGKREMETAPKRLQQRGYVALDGLPRRSRSATFATKTSPKRSSPFPRSLLRVCAVPATPYPAHVFQAFPTYSPGAHTAWFQLWTLDSRIGVHLCKSVV